MQNLSNEDLIKILDTRVQLEKHNEAELIDYIREVDYRRLWIDFGATSLFDFLTHARYTYCDSMAQKKVHAARLMQKFPYIKEQIANGELNVTQLSVVGSAFRKHDPCLKVRAEILEAIRNQTVEATRVIVAEILQIEIRRYEKIREQRDGSVLVEIAFEKEQWAKVQEAKSVLSHQVPFGDLATLFTVACEKSIKKTSPREGKTRQSLAAIHRAVHERDKTCRHKHADGSFCESNYQLQVDHIISVWRGGTNTFENFQLLCGVHNRLKYERRG